MAASMLVLSAAAHGHVRAVTAAPERMLLRIVTIVQSVYVAVMVGIFTGRLAFRRASVVEDAACAVKTLPVVR
jgi:hypothetical protein